MKVDFFTLGTAHEQIYPDLLLAFDSVFKEQMFGEVPHVRDFEKAFAQAHGVEYCAGVSSGTAAIQLTLEALGIGSNHEVIVPANTCFATAAAVSHSGAKPVFVDCDAHYNINAQTAGGAINSKTRAIIAVHLYGQPAPVKELIALCQKHDLQLIEDCAQAHFSAIDAQYTGTVGVAGCFSFYPTKNLGAFGEAGAVITNDKKLHGRIQQLKNLGTLKKNYHGSIGYNYRMDGLQGAFLGIKLEHIAKWNQMRNEHASLYFNNLAAGSNMILPKLVAGSVHSYHLFVIRTSRRDSLKKFLTTRGVETMIHYPVPCHLQKAYKYLGYKPGDLPMAEQFSKQILSLPVSEQHAPEQILYTAAKVNEFLSGKDV